MYVDFCLDHVLDLPFEMYELGVWSVPAPFFIG